MGTRCFKERADILLRYVQRESAEGEIFHAIYVIVCQGRMTASSQAPAKPRPCNASAILWQFRCFAVACFAHERLNKIVRHVHESPFADCGKICELWAVAVQLLKRRRRLPGKTGIFGNRSTVRAVACQVQASFSVLATLLKK